MERVSVEKCPVCGGSDFDHWGESLDTLVSGEPFSVAMCSECGFCFTQQFPSQNEIGKYYESESYVSHSNTRRGLFFKVYHLVRSQMLQRKCKLVKSLVKRSVKIPSLVDYGCGTGYFLNAMRSHRWQVMGLEVSPGARVFADERFGVEVHDIDFLDTIPSGNQDVVTLWHVLEHVEELDLLMNELKRILKPDGRLVIALPNLDSFDARYYRQDWAALDVPRHLWHFCPATFERFSSRHGLQIESQHSMPFDGFYISMMSEQARKSSFPLVRGFLVGLAGWTVSLFNPLRSSSVIYVLRRTDRE